MKARLVLPDEGVAQLLGDLLTPRPAGVTAWALVLYRLAVDPTHLTTWAGLAECSFPGYARVSLTRSLWPAPTVSGGLASSTWGSGSVAWTNTGAGQTVAGFGYLDPVALVLRALLEFPSLVTLNTGGTLTVSPVFTLATDTCTPLP